MKDGDGLKVVCQAQFNICKTDASDMFMEYGDLGTPPAVLVVTENRYFSRKVETLPAVPCWLIIIVKNFHKQRQIKGLIPENC